MPKFLSAVAVVALLAGCTQFNQEVTKVEGKVTNIVGGLAKLTLADATQMQIEAVGQGTTAAPQDPDGYACATYLVANVPSWQQEAAGLLPAPGAVGPLSQLEAVHIVGTNAQQITLQAPAGFSKACAPWLFDNGQVAVQFLNKIGVNVALPTVTGGILGAL